MLFFSQDLISYNACISACEKAGQWLQALKLLHQLQGQKLQGDVIMSPGCSFFVVWDSTGRWCVPEKRWTFQEMERVSQESAITINLTIKMFKSDGSSFNGNGVPKFWEWPEVLFCHLCMWEGQTLGTCHSTPARSSERTAGRRDMKCTDKSFLDDVIHSPIPQFWIVYQHVFSKCLSSRLNIIHEAFWWTLFGVVSVTSLSTHQTTVVDWFVGEICRKPWDLRQ